MTNRDKYSSLVLRTSSLLVLALLGLVVIIAWPVLLAGFAGLVLALALSGLVGWWYFRRWWRQLQQELAQSQQAVNQQEQPVIVVEAETVEEEDT